MNRSALKLVFAAGICAATSALAQTTPQIYGLLDMSAGRFQEPGLPYRWAAQSGGLTTSFIGFRGRDDLGGGLWARFGLESYISVDSGSAGRVASDPFWTRAAYVGFQGAFGTSSLGRLPTPLWTATQQFNPFGESLRFSPSARQYFGGAVLGAAVLGDTHWNNSVLVTSPDAENGFSYSAQVNAGEGAVGATGKNVGLSLNYVSGPLSATGVLERVRNGTTPMPAGFHRQDIAQFGASYEFGPVRLYGQAGRVKTNAATSVKTALYQLGAVAPICLGYVIASYGLARAELTGSTLIRRTASVGYDYFLSKNTDIYAVLMNEQLTHLSTANTVAAGLRLRF